MFAKAARGELNPQQAVADAERQIKPIFDKWRSRGLVGGA
jgi:multiple sugar transport system substrate-binding protein